MLFDLLSVLNESIGGSFAWLLLPMDVDEFMFLVTLILGSCDFSIHFAIRFALDLRLAYFSWFLKKLKWVSFLIIALLYLSLSNIFSF